MTHSDNVRTMRYRVVAVAPLACVALLLLRGVAEANCNGLTADTNSMSARAKEVQAYETSSEDFNAKVSWNAMNHYALAGAHEFNGCDDTSARLLYAVSFADATAIGMHYGLVPWSEGTHDIRSALQIIDALPHSSAVANEWRLVDQLYLKTCGMHGATCAQLAY